MLATPEPSPGGTAAAGGCGKTARDSHDALAEELNQRVRREARRVKVRRTVRQVAEKVPDGAIDIIFDFLQGLLP